MKQTWTIVLAAGLLVACVPESEDGGAVTETEGSTGVASSSETASTSGSTTGASDSDSTTGSTATSGSTTAETATSGSTTAETATSVAETGSTGESETGTTTGGVPAECVERGWDTSFDTWQAAVAEGQGRYAYVVETVTFQNNNMIECNYRTTISVDNGTIVGRSFALFEEFVEGACEDGFEETEETLGENGNFPAAQALLLDQVYLDCCNNHLTAPPDEYDISFSVDDEGLMLDCVAIDVNCGEGCELREPGAISIVGHSFG